MSKPKRRTVEWTISGAAAEFDATPQTLRRGLAAAGVKRPSGSTYSTREVVCALFGDTKLSRLRKLNLESDLLEIERREKERESISMSDATSVLRDILQPVRQRFLALPAEMASRTNPSDPAFAKGALRDWSDDALKLCHEFGGWTPAESPKP